MCLWTWSQSAFPTAYITCNPSDAGTPCRLPVRLRGVGKECDGTMGKDGTYPSCNVQSCHPKRLFSKLWMTSIHAGIDTRLHAHACIESLVHWHPPRGRDVKALALKTGRSPLGRVTARRNTGKATLFQQIYYGSCSRNRKP